MLVVFANSKLRFLMTQVVLNRYPTTVRPDVFDPAIPAAPIFAGGRITLPFSSVR